MTIKDVEGTVGPIGKTVLDDLRAIVNSIPGWSN